jgi:hypothetical protein
MVIDSGYLVVCLVLLRPFGRRFESFPWKPLSSRGRFVDGFDGSDVIYTEVKSSRSCLKSLDAEGGDDQTLRGNSYPFIFIHLYANLRIGILVHLWGPTPETNAGFLICPRLQQDTLASSLIDVAYRSMIQGTWGQATH